MSKHKVIWSQTALNKATQITDYIFENFGLTSVKDFENKLIQLTTLLSENKELCPKSKKLSFRKCLITKQSSLVYFVSKNEVRILTITDNRSMNDY